MSEEVASVKKRDVFTNVEPDTEEYNPEEAKERVLKFLGFPPPKKTCGFQILIAIHTRADEKLKNTDGTESVIVAPKSVAEQDRYRSCVGMVVQIGEEAYQGDRFKYSGAWCKVGDWVQIGRHDGMQFDYRKRPVMLVNDDKIGLVIADPTFAQRGTY